MPKSSEKQKIINLLIEDAAEQILFHEDLDDGDDDAIEEILNELDDSLAIVLSCRRGISSSVVNPDVLRLNILDTMDEKQFRQMLRVGREQFEQLVTLIQDHQVFNHGHSYKQFSIELQLAVVLYRLAAERTTVRKIASIFSVGEGTISVLTCRIFKAFLSLESKYISWPDADERAKIVSDTFHELPYCIGYIDCLTIRLADPPLQEAALHPMETYISSLKAQVVCDYKGRIRHVVMGEPGCLDDAKIYRNSSLCKFKEDYFSSQQWLAGDSALPLSDSIITPFKVNGRGLSKRSQIAYNLQHLKYHQRIVECFDQLKQRFGCLKQIRLRLSVKGNYKLLCDWFLVCCILHNILLKDDGGYLEKKSYERKVVEEPTVPEEASNSDGGAKRREIYSLMFS